MPDPQTLQDQLALRAQAEDPTLNAPWQQAGRQAIDSGMGFLKGITGLGDQGPAGPTATNAGALLGTVGTIPETLIRSLVNIPRTGEATAKLLELLHGVKSLAPEEVVKEALYPLRATKATGFFTPQPTRFSQIYNKLTTNVPEAAEALAPGLGNPTNLTLSRPPGFSSRVRRDAKFRSTDGSQDADLQQLLADRISRPSVTDPSDVQLTAQTNALNGASAGQPPLSRKQQTGTSNGVGQAALKRAGLTEDAVRQLRKMTLAEAQQAYPNKPVDTLRGLITGDVYSWIK